METILHKADTRGHVNFGWLNTYHSFSFGQYYNPERIHFGALRVLNDDIFGAGGGFGTHPHDNMEIITIPIYGGLKHKDSTGGEGVIKQHDVQIMSAGSGIKHSEYNDSKTEAVNLLQIWILPKKRNITPRYDQKTFLPEDRQNTLQTVVAPDDANAVWINQDAWLSIGDFTTGNKINYQLHKEGNGVYAFVINGEADVNGNKLYKRDGLGISKQNELDINVSTNTTLLLIEVPMVLSN